jgi:hypothetical protein
MDSQATDTAFAMLGGPRHDSTFDSKARMAAWTADRFMRGVASDSTRERERTVRAGADKGGRLWGAGEDELNRGKLDWTLNMGQSPDCRLVLQEAWIAHGFAEGCQRRLQLIAVVSRSRD